MVAGERDPVDCGNLAAVNVEDIRDRPAGENAIDDWLRGAQGNVEVGPDAHGGWSIGVAVLVKVKMPAKP
ncbi:MAG TPA: hypothetical protein VGM09_29595 [Bradyrhizobium sp.]